MRKTSETREQFKSGDSGPKYLFRGPHCEWGVIVLNPGQRMGAHGHKAVVEDFLFLEGTPKIIVAGKEERVGPGDAVRAEPGEAHDIINDTGSAIKLVFIKSPHLPDDKYTC